jgi:hypothetical protein
MLGESPPWRGEHKLCVVSAAIMLPKRSTTRSSKHVYCSRTPRGDHHIVVVDFHPDVFSLASRFFYDDIPPSNGMLVRVSEKVVDLTTGDRARAERALRATMV